MSAEAIVYIVDDDESVRDSLSYLLNTLMLQVEPHPSAFEFLTSYKPDKTGCLVLDARMPDISGLELLDILVQRGIRIPVIMTSGCGDIPMAVRAMKNGALDFLEKPIDQQQLLLLIQQGLAADLSRRQEMSQHRSAMEHLNSLTPRETEVLDCIIRGLSNKLIASELGISTKTVEVHRARVMSKMEASSVAELLTKYFSANTHKGIPSSRVRDDLITRSMHHLYK